MADWRTARTTKPKKGKPVIFLKDSLKGGRDCRAGFYDPTFGGHKPWHSLGGESFTAPEVAYWMPFPEIPEESNE